MGKRKTKAIQTELGTFRHNQAYPGIIQAYSKPCVPLAYLDLWYIHNSDIFKIRNIFGTLVYSEPWYIYKSGIFKIQGLFRHLQCQTSMMKCFVKTVKRKQFRSISLPRSLRHEINIMSWLPQWQLWLLAILCKKLWPVRVPGTVHF